MTTADRRIRLQIAWRSMRYRMGATLVMLAVATVGIAAGAFGPIYLHGADQSVLQTSLRGAEPASTGLTLLANSSSMNPPAMLRAAAAAPHLGEGHATYGRPIITVDRTALVTALTNGQPYGADLISRTGICRHVGFASGTCPTKPGTVALSTRSAKELGLRLGGTLRLNLPHDEHPLNLSIAGLYVAPNFTAPYWWGYNYFTFGDGSSSVPEVDDFIVSQPTALGVVAPGRSPLLAQLPLATDQLTTGNVAQLGSALFGFARRAPAALSVTVSTPLTHILATAASEEHTTNTIVEIVLAQLILLALLVLYSVAAHTAESRDPDVRLAELRGFTPVGRASVALLEPVAVLTAALPLGVAGAWLAGVVAAHALLARGGSPSLSLLPIGGALLAYAAGVMATALGTRGLVRRPQLTAAGVGRARGPAAGVAVDAIVVAVAVAAFVEVAASGVAAGQHTDPLAALAPGLLALGLGVVGARAVPLFAGTLVGPTRNSRRVGLSVAVRRLTRVPHIARHVVLLAIAVGLATFAVSGWAVAAHNRSVQASFEVGAWRVLTVQARPGVNFLSAVQRADAGRRTAMAVEVENASDGTTVAVDASRFAAVASWPPGLSIRSSAAIAGQISRAPGPAVTVSGSAIRVTVDLLTATDPAPQLQVSLFDDSYQVPSTLTLGTLLPGTHQYEASTRGSCSPVCRLVNIGLTWPPAATSSADSVAVPVRVTSLDERASGGAWQPLPAGLTATHRWVGTGGSVHLTGSPAGLDVRAAVNEFGGATTFGPNDIPATLPAVVEGSGPGPALGVGLDGLTISLAPVASVDALPGVGSSGASLVDLSLAERLQTEPMSDVTQQVWLAPGAPGDIGARLAARGVAVLSTETAAQRDAVLSATGISQAYAFFLLAAIMAGVLAVASTAFVLVAAARRRRGELSALEAVGVARSVLRRSMLVEQFVVVGTGVVTGVAAGVLAEWVALHSIPEFISRGVGPPLDFQLPLGAFGTAVLAVVVALVATVVLTARLVMGRASAGAVGSEAA